MELLLSSSSLPTHHCAIASCIVLMGGTCLSQSSHSKENPLRILARASLGRSSAAIHISSIVQKRGRRIAPQDDEQNSCSDSAGRIIEHVAPSEEVAGQLVDYAEHSSASTISSQITSCDEDGSDDEFEAYRTSDLSVFKGDQGLQNFFVLQEDQGILSVIYDFYIYMLKKPLPEFALSMFAAPVLVSLVFTLFYLPEFRGLALEETAREFFESNGDKSSSGLQISWRSVFEVFMFSVSLSTGLQPELEPLSPYTLVVANVNALVAQLVFVFLSGAVFARLSQPSQPIRFSSIALVSPPSRHRRKNLESCHKVLVVRYVLVGPQPCELVDVKIDLTYRYNAVTRSGTFFRAVQSLKLVRPEVSYLIHGMLVRHVIDDESPLYRRTPEILHNEDAIFSLSVVGLERSTMQPIFHVQHYCVHDGDVIWNAEFEDMILINKKNRRIVDHSLLSNWRAVNTSCVLRLNNK